MNKASKNFDLIIVGGGASGLTAGIYAARAGLRTMLLEKWLIGGLAATTDLIENYPGFPEGISGKDLMEEMKTQAQKFGAEIIQSEVKMIKKNEKMFEVKTEKKNYRAYAIIAAMGAIPKKLNIPGEEELRGRGVSYCATCDGPLFRDKDIAVVGCGNSGLQEGDFLLKFVKSIIFIELLPHMTADKILQERLKNDPRARYMLNHKCVSINGEDRVSSIILQDRANNQEKTINIDGGYGGDPYGFGPYGAADVDPPYVSSALSLTGFTVEVFFSEEVDPDDPELIDPANYTLEPVTGAAPATVDIAKGYRKKPQ